MKKYLKQAKLFIFEELVKVVVKISENFTLIRLERVEKEGVVDFKFILRVNNTKLVKTDRLTLDLFVVKQKNKQYEKASRFSTIVSQKV